MWIEKVPRRFDFCGCPGCPLCYNWGEDPPVVLALETGALPQEVVQVAPTFDEQMVLIYGTDRPRPKDIKEYEYCHVYVHSGQMDKEDAERQQEIKEAEEEMWFSRWLSHERRNPRIERQLPNLVTCDSIGGEEIERRMEQEKKKRMVTAPLTVEQQQQNVYAQQLSQQREYQSQQRGVPVGTRTYSQSLGRNVVWNGESWVAD